MWRMLIDIGRFYRAAAEFLRAPDASTTLGDLLADGRYSREFVDLHLIPMGAAVWSAEPSEFDRYPAHSLLTFLANHGLLGLGDRPRWRSIRGGSRSYVDALIARFDGSVRLSAPVSGVHRGEMGVAVSLGSPCSREVFDRVILAVHSDQALRMLTAPTAAEFDVLSAIRYQPNRATLHTDVGMLPPRHRAWATWNYDRRPLPPGTVTGGSTVTYDTTRLQHLEGDRRYLVSLNSDAWIDPSAVIRSIDYAHPVFDLAAVAAQSASTRSTASIACTIAARGGATASTRTGSSRHSACANGSA